MPNNVIIGVNILEILTTGMYRDSRVIFREYIQNSCDQIDDAVRTNLLAPDEGQIEIWIDDTIRSVSIEDNATGISAALFRQALYSIGESTKTLGEDKGFRGIGHWCGLGYCKTLVFTSKAYGEKVESIMTCNAEKMRQMMDDHNSHKTHYTVDELLATTVVFSTNKTKSINNHYFKVELHGIRKVHTELCALQQVKDYLAFVAPVGYAPAFRFRSNIHKHAETIGQPIQDYNVMVNGERILKKYTPSFTTSKGEDSITDIDFKDFKDAEGDLVAWLWFGISRFQGVLKKENQMRGIRLRIENIQVGNDDALQKLFNEDRGQHYFIGEVFAIANDLIPNSQRDYFNENETRLVFERLLSDFFNDDLSRIYKAGSNINSKYDKIEKAEQIETEIIAAKVSGGGITVEQQAKMERAKKEAESAEKELAKIRNKTNTKLESDNYGVYDVVVSEIIKTNEGKRADRLQNSAASTSTPTQKRLAAIKSKEPNPSIRTVAETTDEPDERLVPISRIRDIIHALVDPATAKAIIARIEEELL